MGLDIETVLDKKDPSFEKKSSDLLLIDLGGNRIWSRLGVVIILPDLPRLPKLSILPLWADVSHNSVESAMDAFADRPYMPKLPLPRSIH